MVFLCLINQIFASDSFLELTEYSREEILGRNCRYIDIYIYTHTILLKLCHMLLNKIIEAELMIEYVLRSQMHLLCYNKFFQRKISEKIILHNTNSHIFTSGVLISV